MKESGYTFNELWDINYNQQKAISIGINALARIRELLSNWKVRPIDLEVCLQTAIGGVEQMEDALRKNPMPASTKKRHEEDKAKREKRKNG